MKHRRELLLGAVVATVVVTILLRRRGYGIGGDTIVRCRSGHLFTTIWIPGVSLTALRLGWWRLQYCPVGRHWTLVVPVRGADLTDEERRLAEATHDLRIP